MARLLREFIEPPVNGLHTDAPRHLLPRGYAPVHENFLVHLEGQCAVRGPIRRAIASGDPILVSGEEAIIAGVWTFGDKLLVGLMDPNGTAYKPPWIAAWHPAITTALAEPYLTMRYLEAGNASTDTDVVTADAERVVKGRGVRLGAYVYGYGFGGVVEGSGLNDQRRTKFLRWDGTAVTPTEYANAPEGGQDVASYLNRIWVLGGRDVPSGSPGNIEPNALYFSDANGPTADTTAMWQDDATGLVNKILVDSDDRDDFGVALAVHNQTLVIFKRRSIHVLYGYSPDTFQLRTITQQAGCIDARTVVATDAGVFFLSTEGFRLFDGTRVVAVDDSVRTAIGEALGEQLRGDSPTSVPVAFASRLPNDYLVLAIQTQDNSTGERDSSPLFCGLYHIPTGRWTRFSSELFSESNADTVAIPLMAGQAGPDYWMLDSKWLYDTGGVTRTAGSGFFATSIGRDRDGVTNDEPIPYALELRNSDLASGDMSQLHRLITDYTFPMTTEAADAASPSGPRVSAFADSGTTLITEFGLPGAAITYDRRSFVKDAFAEARDITVRFENPDALPASMDDDGLITFQGVTLEYQPTRQTRSS